VSFQAVLEAADRRGRLGGDLSTSLPLIPAAVRADNLRRLAEGRRPRFRIVGSKVALSDWQIDGDFARAERDYYQALDRLRAVSRRSLLRAPQELSQRARGELVVLLLEQMGYSELAPVRRPGAHGAELHLCGKGRGPQGELRTAIVVRRDGREIG